MGCGLVWMYLAEGRENERGSELSRALNLGKFLD